MFLVRNKKIFFLSTAIAFKFCLQIRLEIFLFYILVFTSVALRKAIED